MTANIPWKYTALAAVFLLVSGPLRAQNDQAVCDLMGQSMVATSVAIANNIKSQTNFEEQLVTNLMPHMSGNTLETARTVKEASHGLLEAYKNYHDALAALGAEIRSCKEFKP